MDCHTHWGRGWQEKTPNDPSEWLRIPDLHGVDAAVLMPEAGILRSEDCSKDNDAVAAVAARCPDRIIPVGTAWPQAGDGAEREVERCVGKLGMKGLKFHPWVQGFSTADPVFKRICGLAGEMRIPVFFHDGTPCYSLSEQIGGLARMFPGTRFVLGHSGLLWNWRSALETARRPNVWVCMCCPHLRAIEVFCGTVAPERILWGSDYGFGFSDSIEYRLNLILRARMPESLREKVLGANAMNLLGWGEKGARTIGQTPRRMSQRRQK